MGLLTFAINVTLDGCVDHREGIADDETHDFFTRLMDESGAMLWGRVTYEMMESYWPAVARGAEEAPPAMREWAVKLEAKPKYVVSSTRRDFAWTTTSTSWQNWKRDGTRCLRRRWAGEWGACGQAERLALDRCRRWWAHWSRSGYERGSPTADHRATATPTGQLLASP